MVLLAKIWAVQSLIIRGMLGFPLTRTATVWKLHPCLVTQIFSNLAVSGPIDLKFSANHHVSFTFRKRYWTRRYNDGEGYNLHLYIGQIWWRILYWYMCLNVFLTIRSQFLKIPKFCSLLIGALEKEHSIGPHHAAYSRGTGGGPPTPPAPGKFFNDQPMNDQTLNQCCGAGAGAATFSRSQSRFFFGRSRELELHFLRRLRLHLLGK